MIDTDDLRAAVRACRTELALLDGRLGHLDDPPVSALISALMKLVQVQTKLAKLTAALDKEPAAKATPARSSPGVSSR